MDHQKQCGFCCVSRLSPHEAAILGLWIAGWHPEAIAGRYGIGVETVRSILKVGQVKLDGSERLDKRSPTASRWR